MSAHIMAHIYSSVKWSVLAHLKSQPRGQNFQAQTQWSVLARIKAESTKIPINAFKTNQILKTSILLNLIQCGLEHSTGFELENFAHGVRIQGFPERSILHYSNTINKI